MQADVIVDIIEEDIVALGPSILNILLKDRTTNRNIIWASNDYSKYGDQYKDECEIQAHLITNFNNKIIQPRITKTHKKRSVRTREKAEVFTPSWICNEQNNIIDEQWFGKKNVFNIQKEKFWIPVRENIKRSEVRKGIDTIDKYKVLVSKMSAEHAGEPNKDGMFNVITKTAKVLKPGEICTHSYFLIGNYDSFDEAENTLSYIKTKFVRFLIMITLSAVNLSKLVFLNVPIQEFYKPWTDEELYIKYELNEEEIAFIESMIRPME